MKKFRKLTQEEPVLVATSVSVVLGAILSLAGLEISNERLNEWTAGLVVVINGVVFVIGSFYARSKVTPLDGESLTPQERQRRAKESFNRPMPDDG